jgi:protein-disulfide isomerase
MLASAPSSASALATTPALPAAEVDVRRYLGAEPRYRVPSDDRPCRGSADPLVTIVEFVDFHSPFVRRVEPVVQRLLAAYGSDIRICVRHFPVVRDNANTMAAAECAEEAFVQRGEEGFFRAYDHLLTAPVDPAGIHAAILAANLDTARVEEALADHRHQRHIQSDVELARATGHTGAPNFFIQGRLLAGARPYSDFQGIVEDEITRARNIVAAGVPRRDVFERVLQSSTGGPEKSRSRPGEPQIVWIRLIIVTYGGYGLSPPDRTREQARAIIESLLARIRAGEDFTELARRHSEGSNAPLGGEHGALHRGDLTKETEDAAFSLPVGSVSEVVEGSHGFSIVQRYQ